MGIAQHRHSRTERRISEQGCLIATTGQAMPDGVRELVCSLPSLSPGELPSPIALEARILVAFAPTARDYGRIAYEIRRRAGLFLKPLLMLCSESNPRWAPCVDRELSLSFARAEIEEATSHLMKVGERVEAYRPLDDHTRIQWLHEMLLLRFLDSRTDRSMPPTPNVHLPEGYHYPLAAALRDLPEENGRKLLESLRRMELVTGKIVDRVHTCPNCGDFRVNFREVCPHCGSLVFVEEPVLKHLHCSHVARRSEFQENDGLRCSQCGRKMHHEGVDFSRQDRNFWCRDCGRSFDGPAGEFHCLNCKNTAAPSEPKKRTYLEYSITSEGKLTAQEGSYPETHVSDLLRETPGLYELDAFRDLYALEVARCRRYDLDATLATLSIANLAALLNQHKNNANRQLTSEVKQVLADTFRETDLVTEISRDRLLTIFTHTPPDRAEEALHRLEKDLQNLAASPVKVDTTLFDLRKEAPSLDEMKKNVD